ncbi:MAG: SUMF1/EgtB/PvdO family nonheme iron enzyme [Bacteroidetes bacterium]|nr:SUMF1/EgtB/PvdO family nonheme iron enzyme [Bacteroidota bacterium]
MELKEQTSGKRNNPATPTNIETTTFEVNNVQFKMVAIEGGSFIMGSDADDAKSDQKPTHKVTVSDFSIGQTEVTQELWRAVMAGNPSEFSGKNLPVDNVTWEECQRFVAVLNQLLHETGQLPADKNFHLPTEAQWEYAARGGNKSKNFTYAGSNNINAVAWTRDNSGERTHPVASKLPNELGLYDMSGNVWEWCQDYYDSYKTGDQTNPTGPAHNTGRVIKRGGSWYYAPEHYFHIKFRYGYYTSVTDSSIGVRLCLS